MLAGSGSTFSASYDSTTKFLSAGVCLALLVVAIATRSLLLTCLSALVIGLSYAYSPRAYVISGGTLFVRRPIGRVGIPLSTVRDIRAAQSDDLKGCIRLFGNGGLFGYYGLYRTSKLGKCFWYVTNRDNAGAPFTDAKTVVLSPDDVNGFVLAVTTARLSPQASAAEFASKGAGKFGKWLGIAIGIIALLFVAMALLYSPGPPKYTLTADGLVIHDRFYPAKLKAQEIDLENIRLVDIGTDPDWKPKVRTNGFSNFHYHSGWFKTANGKKVRMYRADSRKLVLLPPKGEGFPVLLEVTDPQAFIKEALKSWQ